MMTRSRWPRFNEDRKGPLPMMTALEFALISNLYKTVSYSKTALFLVSSDKVKLM